MFSVRPKSTYYGYREDVDAEAVCRLLRLAIYANDDTGFMAARDLYEKLSPVNPSIDLVAALFAGVPLPSDWLASRRDAIRLALFDAKISTFLWTGTPGPDTMAVIAQCRVELAGASVPPVLLSYDLVAGDLVGLRKGIANADGALQCALEAALAFLEARNAEALQHYRDALKLHRKQLGRRKIFLDDAHGLLFVLALLGANDAGVLAEAQAGLDIVLRTTSHYTAGFFALQAMVWLAQGLEAKARSLAGQLQAGRWSSPSLEPASPWYPMRLIRRSHAVATPIWPRVSKH